MNVPTDLTLFQGKSKPLQLRRTKKIYKGGLPVYKPVEHYSCLTKKNCQLKSSAMARNTFVICRSK